MKLKDYRTKVAKLSRAKFGALIGVTGITVWRYETGRQIPRPETILAICKVTKNQVTADTLLAPAKGRAQ